MIGRTYRCSFLIWVIVFPVAAWAQDNADSLETEADEWAVDRLHEDLVYGAFESADESQVSEWVGHYRRYPADLNLAPLTELENVPGLGTVLARAIVDFRSRRPFGAVTDLKKLDGMTEDLFNTVRDFVTVAGHSRSRSRAEFRQRTVRNLDASDDNYRGDRYQLYQRAEAQYQPDADRPRRRLAAGIVVEKDAGEPKWNDHVASYGEVRDYPFVRHAVVGNYQLEFGQGLVWWGGRGSIKGSEVAQGVKKSGRGIQPFAYATESGALLGGAAAIQTGGWLRHFEPTIYYSTTREDASFNEDGTIRTLKTDGLHRDSAEIAKRNILHERIWGANVDYRFGLSSVGVTCYEQRYNRRFVLIDTVRSRYNFTGRSNRAAGFHYDLFLLGANWFGETAVDGSGHTAMCSGVLFGRRPWQTVLMWRRYSKAFQNFHASGFGEQNGTQNEEGFYLGMAAQPHRLTKLHFYYDLFRYPWRSYDVAQPVRGDDFLVQWEQRWMSAVSSTFRFKNERKDVSQTSEDAFGRESRTVEKSDTRRSRFQVDWKVLPGLNLRSRVETVRYRVTHFKSENEDGSSFYQDARWQVDENLTLFGRWTVFDTDGSSSAVYEYENDVDGVFTNSLFSDKGSRWYVAVRVRWNRRLTLLIKYWEKYLDKAESGPLITRRTAMSVTYGL